MTPIPNQHDKAQPHAASETRSSGGEFLRREASNVSPSAKLATQVAAAVAEFTECRKDALSSMDINHMLTAGWEILNAVPTLVDARQETHLQRVSLGLDSLCRQTFEPAPKAQEDLAGRGTNARRKPAALKLYTTGELSAGQLDEYAALQIIPDGEARDTRIQAFRAELAEAGIGALLTSEENDSGPGRLIKPGAAAAYDIYYNFEFDVSIVRVYGDRACHRELYDTFIDGYELEEHEVLSQEEIDSGSERFWKLIDAFHDEREDCYGCDLNQVAELV